MKKSEVIDFFVSGCSEKASGKHLYGPCCDLLKSDGAIAVDHNTIYYSCDDYVKYGEYVRDACKETCKGK